MNEYIAPEERQSRIRAALNVFAELSAAQKNKIATRIAYTLNTLENKQGFLPSRFVDFSTIFDFPTKVAGMVERFAPEHLTKAAYLKAAVLNSNLLVQSPVRLEANIRGLAKRFETEEIPVEEFLNAALHAPTMFSQDPKRMERNIRGVVKRFSDEGLTTEAYLKSALRSPSLFSYSPKKVESNIRRTVKRFAKEGLTTQEYLLNAVLKQPELACMKPQTIESNIRTVVKLMQDEGLTVSDYLAAAVKQPQLFCRAPESIRESFERFFHLADDGILVLPAPKQETPPSVEEPPLRAPSLHKQVIGLLTHNPYYLSLGADNIMQRQVVALVTGKKLNTTLLKTSKTKINEILDEYVTKLDHPLPNRTETVAETPSTRIDVRSVAYGEMLLVDMAKRGALHVDLSAKVLSSAGIAA